MSVEKLKIEKIIAILVIVGALAFVAYQGFSDTLSGAVFFKSQGYMDCVDTDPANDVNVLGKATTKKILSYQTKSYETIEKFDECIGGRRVRQWSCLNHKLKPIDSKYCLAGKVCSNGACV